MREDWVECIFEDLLDYEQPTKYIVSSDIYDDSYKIPVLTAGKSFIKGYTNETDGIFDNLPVIIFDDFTTATQFVDFKFKVKSSAMKILTPTSELVNMKFMYYCMQVNQVRSDTHKRYWISVYAKKKFLLPPLIEQKAILSKIEELFSDLDKGIEDLKKAKDQLVIYRQAVCSSAINGSLLNSREYPSVLFGSLISDLGQGWSPRCDVNRIPQPDEWGVIKTTAVQPMSYNELESKPLPKELEPKPSIEIKNGDFLMTRKGPRSRAGVSCYVKTTRPFLMVCDTVYRFRCIEDKVYPKYLELALNAPQVTQAIDREKSGISESGLSLTHEKLKNISIPLPNLEEQHRIVLEVESRLSVCDKVEQSIEESLEKAKALRQSILKKAFEGKLLTKEEIEKCKAEKDYEPAAVLLEKIRKEKEK